MNADQAINILVTVTLIEMMVAIGLGVTVADLRAVARNGRLLAQAFAANYLCVPAITIGLLILFDAKQMVSAGFLILAVCPGAPFGPPLTGLARGNVPVAVGLMMILAGSSAILAPVLLHVLAPLLPGDTPVTVDGARIVVTLLLTQLIPLCGGIGLRHWRPGLAERLQKPANLVSKVLNLSAMVLILVAHFELLAEIKPRGFFGMMLLLTASWATGWLLGGPGSTNRKAMTLTTSLRNVGVGLVIASNAFAGTPAVTATLAYGLVGVFGSLALAAWWGRRGQEHHGAAAQPLAGESQGIP